MIRGGTLEVLVVGLLILEEEAIAAAVVVAAAVATVQAIAEGISNTCLRLLGVPSIKIPYFHFFLSKQDFSLSNSKSPKGKSSQRSPAKSPARSVSRSRSRSRSRSLSGYAMLFV